MDEIETNPIDYAAIAKEAAFKGAVTAVVSIAVTLAGNALVKKVQESRKKSPDLAVVTETE